MPGEYDGTLEQVTLPAETAPIQTINADDAESGGVMYEAATTLGAQLTPTVSDVGGIEPNAFAKFDFMSWAQSPDEASKTVSITEGNDPAKKTEEGILDKLSKNPMLTAALVTAGSKMLGGAATAKAAQELQQEKWDHEAKLLKEKRKLSAFAPITPKVNTGLLASVQQRKGA